MDWDDFEKRLAVIQAKMEDAIGTYCTVAIFNEKDNWFVRVGSSSFIIDGDGPKLKDVFDAIEEVVNDDGFKAKVEVEKKKMLAEQMTLVPPAADAVLN